MISDGFINVKNLVGEFILMEQLKITTENITMKAISQRFFNSDPF